MEEKSEETLKTEQQIQSQTLDRPKEFILQRRKEIFYFSDDSTRGILKRVPVKDGIFQITELETVLDKPGAAKTRKEICSGLPFNRPGSSKVKQSSSASKTDNVCKPADHEQKQDNVLKKRRKVDGFMQQSQSLGIHENDLKVKDKYQDPMMVDNNKQKEIFFQVPVNTSRSSKVNQSISSYETGNVCKPAYHEQKQDIVLKQRGKMDGFMQHSQRLRNHEEDLKTKDKYQDPMMVDNNKQKEIFFEVPVNTSTSSKVNQSSSASKNDNECKPDYHKQKRGIILKSEAKVDGYITQSQSLGVHKIDLNSKEKHQYPLIDDQQEQEKNMYLKPYKEIERQQQKDGDVGIYRSKSDGISTSSLKKCSSKKTDEIGSNNLLYSDSWFEEHVSDDLRKMSTNDYEDPLMVDNMTRKGICSENPINRYGGSNVNQNSSASENDTASKPVYHKRKGEIILKSQAKVDGCIKQSQNPGDHKKDLKAKKEHGDPMIHDNMVEKKDIFLKPCKEIKMQQTKDGDVSICKEFHGSKSDEISTSSLKNCSSKKPEEIRSNNSLYSDSWSETFLSDDLSKMPVKTTFITEL